MKGLKTWLLNAVTLITLAGCSPVALASVLGDIPMPLNSPSKILSQNRKIKTMQVKLIILKQIQSIELPEGSTINEALEAVTKIKHGVVCCDNRDIQCINDLCQDPYKNEWWVIKVNGNSQNYSSHSRLSPGDVVELVWTGKIEHRRLQEWLLSFSGGK